MFIYQRKTFRCIIITIHGVSVTTTHDIAYILAIELLIRQHNWTQNYSDCFSNVCLVNQLIPRLSSFSDNYYFDYDVIANIFADLISALLNHTDRQGWKHLKLTFELTLILTLYLSIILWITDGSAFSDLWGKAKQKQKLNLFSCKI